MRTSLATLRVFAAVAESGNIRLAAERLGRTPSSISEKLKQFEQDIGAPLFESGRKNRLTPVGSFVHTQVRDLLSHVDRKLASLHAHASQLGDWDFEPVVRQWARETAEQHPGNGEYVESFKYFKLD